MICRCGADCFRDEEDEWHCEMCGEVIAWCACPGAGGDDFDADELGLDPEEDFDA